MGEGLYLYRECYGRFPEGRSVMCMSGYDLSISVFLVHLVYNIELQLIVATVS